MYIFLEFSVTTVIVNVQYLEKLVLTRQKLLYSGLFHMEDHLTIMTCFQQCQGSYKGPKRPAQMSRLLGTALPWFDALKL